MSEAAKHKDVADRKFMIEFIKVYRSLPSLWNTKSEEYCNKHKKSQAYDILLQKYRQKYPDAEKFHVTRKINTLRTNFRREAKRLEALNKNGFELNKPTLWYFDIFSFVKDCDASYSTYNAMQDEEEQTEEEEEPVRKKIRNQDNNDSPAQHPLDTHLNAPVNHLKKTRKQENNDPPAQHPLDTQFNAPVNHLKKTRNQENNDPPAQHPLDTQFNAPVNHFNKTRNQENNDPPAQHPLDTHFNVPVNHLNQSSPSQDNFNKMAEVWASKLRQMSSSQQLYAEKFINDIIFEGILGTLTRNTVQINTQSVASPKVYECSRRYSRLESIDSFESKISPQPIMLTKAEPSIIVDQ